MLSEVFGHSSTPAQLVVSLVWHECCTNPNARLSHVVDYVL